jgi:hypothetical protein
MTNIAAQLQHYLSDEGLRSDSIALSCIAQFGAVPLTLVAAYPKVAFPPPK